MTSSLPSPIMTGNEKSLLPTTAPKNDVHNDVGTESTTNSNIYESNVGDRGKHGGGSQQQPVNNIDTSSLASSDKAGSPTPPPDVNEDYDPVHLMSDLELIPPIFDKIIRSMLEDLGFPEPRSFQVNVIFHIVERKVALVHLIQKMGEGKSLCLIAMSAVLGGVTIALGPLHGLGTDQAVKSKSLYKGIKAYHVDEFRDSDYHTLVQRMK